MVNGATLLLSLKVDGYDVRSSVQSQIMCQLRAKPFLQSQIVCQLPQNPQILVCAIWVVCPCVPSQLIQG